MSFFNKLAKGISFLINPAGLIIDQFQHTPDNSHRDPNTGKLIYNGTDNVSPGKRLLNKFGNWISNIWNDVTGQSAIDKQNQANLDLAKYQSDMQEEFYNSYSSPEAIMRQYQEAGLNPNLMYSSSGSGQGNVPSFNAPTVNRRMSFAEQVSKGLSIMSGLLNVQNLIYNTAASREIAEQNGVKTLGLLEDVLTKRRKNEVESNIVGYFPSSGFHNLFRRSSVGRRSGIVDVIKGEPDTLLERYSDVMRQERFNKAYKVIANNMYEYGNYTSPIGDMIAFKPFDDFKANAIWRNGILEFDRKQRLFNYNWDEDYKTIMKSMGVAAPVAQILMKLLGSR